MAQHNVYTFFSVHNCLDAEFDVPDAGADHDLCHAIVAGRMGLHPDAWGNHDPLPLRWLLRRRPVPEVPHEVLPVDPAWEAKHRRRPVEKPKPRWRPHTSEWPPVHGDLQLTCDVCHRARFHITLEYRGDRPMKVAAIRAIGRQHGWTRIAGTDRCPACSQAAAPKPVGNGAGGNQCDEQDHQRGH